MLCIAIAEIWTYCNKTITKQNLLIIFENCTQLEEETEKRKPRAPPSTCQHKFKMENLRCFFRHFAIQSCVKKKYVMLLL